MTKKSFVRYVGQSDAEPQSLYIDSGAALDIVPELREKGARRLLVICDNQTRRLNAFTELMDCLKTEGFRVFVYSLVGQLLQDNDILAGLKIFLEYNCDTAIAIGGTSEIDCGKLVCACAANSNRTLSQLTGINKIKNSVPTVCCILSSNCASASTPSAEYYSNETKLWKTVFSNYLIPHMVVIDPEFSDRVAVETIVLSTLSALCMTIEAYINPSAGQYPEYKASSLIASTGILCNLDKLCNNPTDAYLRKQIAVAGFYAGLSARKTGIGYAHIIMHCLMNRYGTLHGVGLDRILPVVLTSVIDRRADALAELARTGHFCSTGLSSVRAAESYIGTITRAYQKLGNYYEFPVVKPEDVDSIVSETEQQAAIFGIRGAIDTKTLYGIVQSLVK